MRFLDALHGFVAGKERGLAYAVAVLTVLATWGAILTQGDRVKSLDEGDFYAIAENLAFHGEFRNENGDVTAFRAPGLVFFIVPFVRFGAGLMELRMINAVLVGLGLVLLFHLLRRHGGPLAGLLGVVLVPCWPVIVYAATTIYPQTLAAFLLVLTVFLLDRLTVDGRKTTALLAGCAYGALVLTVPTFLLMAPVFALWIALTTRIWLVRLAIFALISAAMTGAWTVRNYIVFDAFVPVASSSGYNLLAGNTPAARYNTSLDVRFEPEVYTAITGKNEIERDEIFTRAAIAAIREDPERFFWLYLGKFLHWFDYSNRLMSDDVVEGGASAIPPDTRELVLLAAYAMIVLPLLAHVLMMRRYPFKPIELLFVALWICGGLAYAIYFTRIRFRMPFDWLIIGSNAIFLAAVIERAVQRRTGRSPD